MGCEEVAAQFHRVFARHKLLRHSTNHDADVPIMLWVGERATVIRGTYFLSLPDKKEFKLDVLESMALEPYVVFMEHDAAWGYELHQTPGTRRFFYTKPVLYDFKPEDNPPNPAAFEELFGVPRQRIERYFRTWSEVPLGDRRAYPSDEFDVNDWQQVEDLIKVLIGGIRESYELIIEEVPS
jgi:hypothetical protein